MLVANFGLNGVIPTLCATSLGRKLLRDFQTRGWTVVYSLAHRQPLVDEVEASTHMTRQGDNLVFYNRPNLCKDS